MQVTVVKREGTDYIVEVRKGQATLYGRYTSIGEGEVLYKSENTIAIGAEEISREINRYNSLSPEQYKKLRNGL